MSHELGWVCTRSSIEVRWEGEQQEPSITVLGDRPSFWKIISTQKGYSYEKFLT